MVDGEGEGEEQVAQSIGPSEQLLRYRFDLVECPELAFGPSGDGARDVQFGRGPDSAGHHEGIDGLQRRGESVDLRLEPAHVAIGDRMGRRAAVRRLRQLGLGDEELVLQPLEELRRVRPVGRELGGRAAEMSPQLVVRAEGADPRGILPYAGATNETGLATVAAAGV